MEDLALNLDEEVLVDEPVVVAGVGIGVGTGIGVVVVAVTDVAEVEVCFLSLRLLLSGAAV